MIVKNEEKYLNDCLLSVYGVVDEIVIADTGSTDNTKEIAQRYGAKLYDYKWNDNFSEARNFALSKCSGKYILYLDADERLSPGSKDLLLETTKKGEYGFRCLVHSLNSENPSIMMYTRLFPNLPGVRFTGRIHEQIEPALIKKDLQIINCDIKINHLGYDLSPLGLINKAKRNLPLILKEYEDTKSSYYAFQLGQTYGILNMKMEAVESFKKAIEDSFLLNEYMATAFRYLAIHEAERFNYREAGVYIDKSLMADGRQPLTLMAAAKIYLQLNNIERANQLSRLAVQVNKELTKGANTNQTILMNEVDLCCHGLETAVQTENKDSKEYFLSCLKELDTTSFTELLFALIENKMIEDIDKYSDSVNRNNAGVLLKLLDTYTHTPVKINLLKAIIGKSRNAEVLAKLGTELMRAAQMKEAEGYLHEAFMLSNDPSLLFYLVSVNIQLNQFSKISDLIRTAEIRHSDDIKVLERINLLKHKLASVIN